MEMRPIAHLEYQHVFAKGVLQTWQRAAEGYVAVLLTHVTLTDYDTDKQTLAPVLDHCWIYAREAVWKIMKDFHICFDNHVTLLDEVYCVCRVEGYRRSNGTRDYGLRLINWFPMLAAQQISFRKIHAKMAKYYKKGKANGKGDPARLSDLCQEYSALSFLDLSMGDWRCRGRTLRDARAQIKQNISYLQGYLIPILGIETVESEVDHYMLNVVIPDMQGLLRRRITWHTVPDTGANPTLAVGEAIKATSGELSFPEAVPNDAPDLITDPTFLARVQKQPSLSKSG